MKILIAASLMIIATVTSASDIILAKNINTDLRKKITKDLELINNFKFSNEVSNETLKVMGVETLNAETATDWLNKRVNYIISENALSLFNLLVKRTIFVEKKDIDFPNAGIVPYSIDRTPLKDFIANLNTPLLSSQDEEAFTVMSNIGTALYYGGKKERKIYGMKISRGLLKRAEKIEVTSPRSGIIQIGAGLFDRELAVNKNDDDAMANSIFRLGTFFHEARHSDGNGKSLGFMHAICPAGHDYENQAACDENLNGPYKVGALMVREMSKACQEKCSEKDKQILKLIVIDSASRILKTTRKGEISNAWDAHPESL